LGLGVRSGAQAAEIAEYADGVIVGSALVSALGGDGVNGVSGVSAVRTLTGELAAGVREKVPAT
jgi:tryptophan synthase alpha chain